MSPVPSEDIEEIKFSNKPQENVIIWKMMNWTKRAILKKEDKKLEILTTSILS